MSRRIEREAGTVWNYGAPMAGDTKASTFPDRYARQCGVGEWLRGTADPLKRRPFFACGEARKIGWARAIWRNEYMRAICLERARTALAKHEVLPLP
jgi:hypothetical protein